MLEEMGRIGLLVFAFVAIVVIVITTVGVAFHIVMAWEPGVDKGDERKAKKILRNFSVTVLIGLVLLVTVIAGTKVVLYPKETVQCLKS